MAKAENLLVFNKFLNHLPRCHGIEDKFVPNPMFHLGFVPFFTIKHLIIFFNPNGPKRDAYKKMSNLNHVAKLFRNLFPEHRLFSIKVVVIAGPHPANINA